LFTWAKEVDLLAAYSESFQDIIIVPPWLCVYVN
jgi:hypothetical protein